MSRASTSLDAASVEPNSSAQFQSAREALVHMLATNNNLLNEQRELTQKMQEEAAVLRHIQENTTANLHHMQQNMASLQRMQETAKKIEAMTAMIGRQIKKRNTSYAEHVHRTCDDDGQLPPKRMSKEV